MQNKCAKGGSKCLSLWLVKEKAMKYRTEEIEIRNDRQELLSTVYVSPYFKHYHTLLAKYRKVFLVTTEACYLIVDKLPRTLDVVYPDMYTRKYVFWGNDFPDDEDCSENVKDMNHVIHLCEMFSYMGVDRDSLVVAYGGGVVLDMVGFAASIYLRGVDVAYVPTTFLAQVDASLGGKTAVNLDGYKNIMGTFKQPVFTFSCTGVLRTLPDIEFRNGLAEMLKTFMIEDNGNYEKAVKMFSEAGENWRELVDGREFRQLLAEAIKVKAGIVGRDMYEKGERRLLNLGHTFAHAIEHNAFKKKSPISHGQAVSIGTILAARLSENMGMAPHGFCDRLIEDFRACGLPTECPFPLKGLLPAMKKDKKASGSKIHFVLPRGIGDVVIEDMTVAKAAGFLKK